MYLITGNTGFIGSALSKKLGFLPVSVKDLPMAHADYFFHFGSPSSQVLFSEDDQCINDTITDFIKVVEYCKKRHLKLVFPSSANVYTNNNAYAHTKSALEEIVKAYELPHVAYRIFCGYGAGEEHKKHYASVVYQWIKQIVFNQRPVIYGDGEQTRDFVYIDDIVNTILNTFELGEGVIDIGTGLNTPFNQVIKYINKALRKNIEPIYKPKPTQYIQETICNNPLLDFVPIEKGIQNIVANCY